MEPDVGLEGTFRDWADHGQCERHEGGSDVPLRSGHHHHDER